MKHELKHFKIGYSYGGNQDWFPTFMMRIGGCGAETACDSSLYFAIHRDIENIYPFDKNDLTKADYVKFAHMIEKYLWPRMSGINRVDIFIEGYAAYLKDRGIRNIEMEELSGSEPYEKAAAAMIRQIDNGYPVPLLILNHRDRSLKDYVWHWFLINGYDRPDGTEDIRVKAVTYSGYQWLDLRKLWDTGYMNRGGAVLYRIDTE